VAWQSSIVGNLRLSLLHFTHFHTKVDGSDLKIAVFLTGCRRLISCSNASLGPGSAVGKKPEKWRAKQAEQLSEEGRHASGG